MFATKNIDLATQLDPKNWREFYTSRSKINNVFYRSTILNFCVIFQKCCIQTKAFDIFFVIYCTDRAHNQQQQEQHIILLCTYKPVCRAAYEYVVYKQNIYCAEFSQHFNTSQEMKINSLTFDNLEEKL